MPIASGATSQRKWDSNSILDIPRARLISAIEGPGSAPLAPLALAFVQLLQPFCLRELVTTSCESTAAILVISFLYNVGMCCSKQHH